MLKSKQRIFLAFLLFLSSMFCSVAAYAQQSLLDSLIEQGEIRIGTTGDYKPFSYWNTETEAYEGLDIDAAQLLADALGVSVLLKVTWRYLNASLTAKWT